MGMFFYIIGSILFTHPPDVAASTPAPASIAAAAMIYLCEWTRRSIHLVPKLTQRRRALLLLLGTHCLGLCL